MGDLIFFPDFQFRLFSAEKVIGGPAYCGDPAYLVELFRELLLINVIV